MEDKLFIHEALVWPMEARALSTVLVQCEKESREEIKESFRKIFKAKWEKAEEDTIDEVGVEYEQGSGYYPEIEDGVNPLEEVTDVEEGFTVRFSPILIPYCYGDFCEVAIPCEAVDEAFETLKEENPDIFYIGLIAFPWSDRRCGDIEEYSFVNGDNDVNKVLRYVWKHIAESCKDEEFVEMFRDEVKNFDDDDVLKIAENIFDAWKDGFLSQEAAAVLLETVSDVAEEDADEKIAEKIGPMLEECSS